MAGKLVLVRHGESEWNALGKWTGWTDVSITENGVVLSRQLGEKLQNIKFDVAYHSLLKRTAETLEALLVGGDQMNVKRNAASEINERDYGVFTGMLKEEVRLEIGEESYLALRRGWDRPIEKGESLKDVYARVIPFYQSVIMPQLIEGKNILIVGHGNSLRALLKFIENISEQEISTTEFGHNIALVYEIDQTGRQASKEVVSIN